MSAELLVPRELLEALTQNTEAMIEALQEVNPALAKLLQDDVDWAKATLRQS